MILCLFFNEHELCAKTAQILRLFFNEHELCAKTARILRLFFNEHEMCAKTARILRLFFNEHELCAKTARLSSHMIRMSHVRFHFLWSLRLTKLCPASFRYASSETTNPMSLKG